jgi:hypothetical protein
VVSGEGEGAKRGEMKDGSGVRSKVDCLFIGDNTIQYDNPLCRDLPLLLARSLAEGRGVFW